MKTSLALLLATVPLLLVGSPAGIQAQDVADDAGQAVLYTAQNIWYENPLSLWCINYKTGTMIPAGTAVRDVQFARTQAGLKSGAEERAISFTRVEDGVRFFINFRAAWHPGKSMEEYIDIMFSERDFDSLTKGLTAKEIDAIERGVVVIGMGKKAVLISYGVPPEHKTPDLSENIWHYWVNRFRTKKICFDDQEKALNCKELEPPDEL